MFVTCWGEPGFHRFWRLWNPFYGYGLFRIYLALGGKRRPLLASLVVFLLCGFVAHDLVMVPTTRRLGFTTTVAFAVFWLLATLSRALEGRLRQDGWPRPANALLNTLCICIGLVAGALVTSLLRR